MIVYVPIGAGPTRERIIAAGHGMISNRDRFGMPDCRWIMDNGAWGDFQKREPFDAEKYVHRLSQIIEENPCRWPEWAVVPDKVADRGSLSWSVCWRKWLCDDLRWFLAVQDGMRPLDVEQAMTYVKFDGIFVGGSSDFKNQTACEWVRFAHGLRLPCHIGRVNGWKRLQWAVDIGADSIDGTGWTRSPAWIKYLENMPEPTPQLWAS